MDWFDYANVAASQSESPELYKELVTSLVYLADSEGKVLVQDIADHYGVPVEPLYAILGNARYLLLQKPSN